MASEKTACILCSRNCGLKVEIENGKFTKIRGDKDHPLTKGYICQKQRVWNTIKIMVIDYNFHSSVRPVARSQGSVGMRL